MRISDWSSDVCSSDLKLFTESLVKRGQLSLDEAEKALDDYPRLLQQALDETLQSAPAKDTAARAPRPAVGVLPPVPTGVPRESLDRIYSVLSSTPEGFSVHPKLAKQFTARDKMWAEGEVDWALAEALAYGSLLLEGTDLRIAGQSSEEHTSELQSLMRISSAVFCLKKKNNYQ